MRLHLIEFFQRAVCARKAKNRIECIILPIRGGKKIIKNAQRDWQYKGKEKKSRKT